MLLGTFCNTLYILSDYVPANGVESCTASPGGLSVFARMTRAQWWAL